MGSMDKDARDVLIAGLIGAALGVAAVSIYYASTARASGNSLGRAMVRMGEMLDGSGVGDVPGLKNVDRKMDKYEDTVADVLSLISTGIRVWDKIKRGV